MAGLPDAVVERARVVLDKLEQGEREGHKNRALIDDLPLFSAMPPPVSQKPKVSEVEVRLDEIQPDGLTPLEALSLIYELKGLNKN